MTACLSDAEKKFQETSENPRRSVYNNFHFLHPQNDRRINQTPRTTNATPRINHQTVGGNTSAKIIRSPVPRMTTAPIGQPFRHIKITAFPHNLIIQNMQRAVNCD